MRFCVLGSVAVAAERQRAILGMLLAAGGEVVSTDRLIDGLWGAQPPPSAHKSQPSVTAATNARLDRGWPG